MAENGTLNGRTAVPLFREIGHTGLRQMGGRLDEEWLRQLRSREIRYRVYREMSENDAIIGAGLRVIEMLVRQVTWEVEPASDDNAALEAADWVRGALFDDMSSTWNDVVTEALSMLIYGWSFHEICYKKRDGEHSTPGESSQFTDGLIGWRKFPIRAQETLDKWLFDDNGGVAGMQQNAPGSGGSRPEPIPIELGLLFRTSHHKGSPEGNSVLRNAWRSWVFKKRIEEIQGIGIETDLTGLKLFRAPAQIMGPDATLQEQAIYEVLKKAGRDLRNNEQSTLIIPSDRDEDGHPFYDFQLVASPGTKQIDTKAVLEYYDKSMMLSMMTDIVLIGHEKVGSYSLADSKTSLMSVAISTYLQEVKNVFNRHALPRIWRLNGLPRELQPSLVSGDIESVNLEELGNFVLRISQAGFTVTDLDFENEIRRRAQLPALTEEAAQQAKQEAAAASEVVQVED